MKKTKKYYWKVVRKKDDGSYTSCIITKGKYSATYKVGKYIKAPLEKNGLMVFKSRILARDFKRENDSACDWNIFKVSVRGNEIINPVKYSIYDLMDGVIPSFTLDIPFPDGTCCLPEVMLIEKSR